MSQLIELLQKIITLNNFFTWDYVWKYVFFPAILQGVVLTIILSVIAQALGTVLGLVVYFMRRSSSRILRGIAGAYVFFFRGTPLLVQLLIFYSLFPYLGLARPLRQIAFFNAIGFTHGVGPVFLDSFIAGVLALSLNEGAYMSEIVRAGIDAIDVGQFEAAKSLGMTYGTAMRRIILPQAFRIIIPPLGNEFNNMLKNSAQASVIGLSELLNSSTVIGGPLFGTLELLLVASFWFLVLTSIWTVIQASIERRLNTSNLDPALRDRSRSPWYARMFGLRYGEESIRPATTTIDGH